jgi:hypothetical protein
MTNTEPSGAVVPLTSSISTPDPSVTEPVKQARQDVVGNIIRNFKNNVKNWPIHLSYEGSALLCVILALDQQAKHVSLNQLPKIDQEAILKAVGVELYSSFFEVEFDHIKDFILTLSIREGDTTRKHRLTAFNTVAHPRPEDFKDSPSVKIEENGETIQVGGKITLNKKNIPKLAGLPDVSSVEEEVSKRPILQANRNAYEIRTDVLKMAVDWGMREHFCGNEDDVLKVAKKFYAFVENKR